MDISITVYRGDEESRLVVGNDAKLSYSQITYTPPGGEMVIMCTDFEIKFSVKDKTKGLVKRGDWIEYSIEDEVKSPEKYKLMFAIQQKEVFRISFRESSETVLPGFK
jgi:hypothetical protein